jgi:predicted MFS family arabinose efflux permease
MTAEAWKVTIAAALLMALGNGLRVTSGLFVSSMNSATGMGLALLSLVLAVGQLAVGLAQPLLGTWADRWGAARLVGGGALVLCLATVACTQPALWAQPIAMALMLVTSALAASAMASNGILVGEVNRRVDAARAGLAVALVGAGASLGQMLVAPATQWLIRHVGWVQALLASAALALLALPLSLALQRRRGLRRAEPSPPVADVLRDARFWRVAGSFGVCGFHVTFMAVHMPGVLERCGLDSSLAGLWLAVAGAANIAGSIAMGRAMRSRDHVTLLLGMYAVRMLGIAALLAAPATESVLLAFAAVMGASHMATLPPTAQLVARHHGVTRLGSLFGLVMLVHQLGGFAGVWLGGWAAAATGSDRLLWGIDIALAALACALLWPLRATRRRGIALPFYPG